MAYDLAWLTAAVKSWTRRSDIAAQIPDFLMFAEERMSADLLARGLDTKSTLPTVAGAATVALPPEVIEIIALSIPGAAPLDYLPPDRFTERFGGASAGQPCAYTVIGDTLYLGPTPTAAYEMSLTARKTLPPLATAADGTNWLIKRNPSLYLAATMFEAMVNLRDDAGQQTWTAKYLVALGAANSTQNTPSDLVVRSDSRTP